MKPVLRRLALAVALALVALVATGATAAQAMLPSRLAVADAAAALAGRTLAPSATVGWDLIREVYRTHGVQLGSTSVADLESACTPLDGTTARSPAPGDLAVYIDPRPESNQYGGQSPPEEVAVYVASGQLLLYNSATERMEIHRAAEINGMGATISDGPPLARQGSLVAYRLPPRVWPGGKDDTSITPGLVAIADPGQIASDLTWSAAHPRDADYSFGHQESLAIAAFSAIALIAFVVILGPQSLVVMAALLAAAKVVGGATYDGRLWHAALTAVTGVLVFWFVVAVAPELAPLLLYTVVGLGVARVLNVPVVGAVGGWILTAGWNVLGFIVTVVTGVEPSDHASLLAVFLALGSAPTVWLRPLLGMRASGEFFRAASLSRLSGLLDHTTPVLRRAFGPLLRGGSRGLHGADTLSDLTTIRPSGYREFTEWIRRGVRGSGPGVITGATRTAAEARTAVGWRAMDVVSLLWRPEMAANDALQHVTALLTEADQSLRAGMHGFTLGRFRPWLFGLSASGRTTVTTAASWTSRHVVPFATGLAHLSRLHYRATTVTSLATGNLLTPELNSGVPRFVPAPWQPPASPPTPHQGPPPAPAHIVQIRRDAGRYDRSR